MTAKASMAAPVRPLRHWRRIECVLVYLVAPVATTLLVLSGDLAKWELPTAFLALFALSMFLLAITPGVGWRKLLLSHPLPAWRPALAFAVVTALGLMALTYIVSPWGLFSFPRNSPEMWRRVMIFYPLLSVLPQGFIFRALFFARYRDLFPNTRAAILASAVAFSMAHLFFMNPMAVGLTFAGGLVFAWAHEAKGSFWFGNLLHAFGGWTIFTVGLGRYFYHGAI